MAALTQRQDAVVGPALDGGYVLVGVKRADRRLFDGVNRGTDSVMAATRERLRSLGWGWQELPTLTDIDRPQDLKLLKNSPLFLSV